MTASLVTVRPKALWASIAERVGWTFAQAALAFYLAHDALDWTVAKGAAAAGVAAVVTLGFAAVQSAAVPTGLGWATDLGLRTIRSAVAAGLAFLLVDPTAVLTGDAWRGAATAAGVAALAALKGAAAKFVGNADSAALLPAKADPSPSKVGDAPPNPAADPVVPGVVPDYLTGDVPPDRPPVAG